MSESFIEQREKADAELRANLTALGFDGPHDLGGALDFVTIVSGGGPKGAICLTCGALVLLNDAEEHDDRPPTERAVRLHWQWHQNS